MQIVKIRTNEFLVLQKLCNFLCKVFADLRVCLYKFLQYCTDLHFGSPFIYLIEHINQIFLKKQKYLLIIPVQFIIDTFSPLKEKCFYCHDLKYDQH
ncbi:hypothetical protein BpHYR1_047340 [Brachionus plicatilis]|uniref:Uncharacterized protein n=1 Tax=Brachionus plicatilis TaxID=10195 RepID=A0A3M7RTU2_BRAPC|nr:hypothetical protein BpHYR1_047340 [Brachionus plicatilis]